MQTGYKPKLLVALETKLLQKIIQLCPEAGSSQKPEVTADQITNYAASESASPWGCGTF